MKDVSSSSQVSAIYPYCLAIEERQNDHWPCAENDGGATEGAERPFRQVLPIPVKCCQERANAAASHFEWREGIFTMPYWTAAGLGGLPWQVWEAHLTTGRDEFTSFQKQFCWYSTGGQQIFYTLALWYCSSSYCNLSSTAIWQQADRNHFFSVLTERGSACWPSCCSLTGAHCCASVRWHVQAACKESCHAMLHWAILAWTKPTVTVS